MIHELVYFKFNIWALSKDRTEYNLTNYFYKVWARQLGSQHNFVYRLLAHTVLDL